MKLRSFSVVPMLMLSILSLSLLASCGKAKYQKQELSATAVAGQYTKPKIDIVIFQDNSDSMNTPIQYIKPQLLSFLSSISSNWDYHFVVMPLLYSATMSQKYMTAADCTGLANCVPMNAFNNAPGDTGWINSNVRNGNTDYGLYNMLNNLSDPGMTSSGFFRSDAALASIIVTDGNDISTVKYTTNAGGQTIIDVAATNAGLNQYVTAIKNLKPTAIMSKLYAVIAPGNSNDLTSCYGTQVFGGGSYAYVSSQLGIQNSLTYNICSGGALAGVLNDIGTQLQALIQAYQFNYIVLSDQPNPSTISVTKNGVSIPQSSTNGWQYVGYRANQATSFSPAMSNVKSGYMIQLTGSAVYKGTDLINVTYKTN